MPGVAKTGPIDSCPIHLEDDDGRIQEMRILRMALSEGTLFILDQDRWQETHPIDMPGGPHPASPTDAEAASGKTPFSVISAGSMMSRSIVDTLLPETYFQIMTRIWDESDRVLAGYGGTPRPNAAAPKSNTSSPGTRTRIPLMMPSAVPLNSEKRCARSKPR